MQIFDNLTGRRLLAQQGETVRLTERGRRFFAARGIDVAALERGRRTLCGTCLDWSERRSHLRGALGASLFQHMLARKWATRSRGSRVVQLPSGGEQKILAWLAA